MHGPTWFDANYAFRVPIIVDGSATTAGSKDVTWTAPKTLQPFWRGIQSTGYDVRFTNADGVSPLNYNRASFNYATNTAQFDIDAATMAEDNSMFVLWCYFGYASATDGSTSPTISGALTAYALEGGPTRNVVGLIPEDAGQTTPSRSIQVNEADVTLIWWQLPLLNQRSAGQLYNDKPGWEGPDWFKGTVTAGGPTHNTSAMRLTYSNGRLYLRSTFSGGSTGNDYYAGVIMATTEGRELQSRITVEVQDVAP